MATRENILPPQGFRSPRGRHGGSTVPAAPLSSSDDGLPRACGAGALGEPATAAGRDDGHLSVILRLLLHFVEEVAALRREVTSLREALDGRARDVPSSGGPREEESRTNPPPPPGTWAQVVGRKERRKRKEAPAPSVRVAPAAAGAEGGRVVPLPRCFRCAVRGHVSSRCPAPQDRGNICYGCGEAGHLVGQCGRRPHCPACAERGLRAGHRIGGASCPPVPPRSRGRKRRGRRRRRRRGGVVVEAALPLPPPPTAMEVDAEEGTLSSPLVEEEQESGAAGASAPSALSGAAPLAGLIGADQGDSASPRGTTVEASPEGVVLEVGDSSSSVGTDDTVLMEEATSPPPSAELFGSEEEGRQEGAALTAPIQVDGPLPSPLSEVSPDAGEGGVVEEEATEEEEEYSSDGPLSGAILEVVVARSVHREAVDFYEEVDCFSEHFDLAYPPLCLRATRGGRPEDDEGRPKLWVNPSTRTLRLAYGSESEGIGGAQGFVSELRQLGLFAESEASGAISVRVFPAEVPLDAVWRAGGWVFVDPNDPDLPSCHLRVIAKRGRGPKKKRRSSARA